MKLWHLLGGAALTVIFSCSADEGKNASAATMETNSTEPNTSLKTQKISGSVSLPENVTLPENAELTVTISAASTRSGSVEVIARQVVATQGKQSPFNFELPYNPTDIKPGVNAILSAAVTTNGQLAFIPEKVGSVTNSAGANKDLN